MRCLARSISKRMVDVGASTETMRDDGSQPSQTAKTSIASRATKKVGVE